MSDLRLARSRRLMLYVVLVVFVLSALPLAPAAAAAPDSPVVSPAQVLGAGSAAGTPGTDCYDPFTAPNSNEDVCPY